MSKFCLVKDFEARYGYYTANAIRHKIKDGTWLNGREYTKSPDGHIFLIIAQIEKYIESTKPTISKDLMY